MGAGEEIRFTMVTTPRRGEDDGRVTTDGSGNLRPQKSAWTLPRPAKGGTRPPEREDGRDEEEETEERAEGRLTAAAFALVLQLLEGGFGGGGMEKRGEERATSMAGPPGRTWGKEDARA